MSRSAGWFLVGFLTGVASMLLAFMWVFPAFMHCVYQEALRWLEWW